LKPPALKCRSHSGKREENPLPKKTEKEEKKIFFVRRGKKTELEEDSNFKPPQLPHFQPDALRIREGFNGASRARFKPRRCVESGGRMLVRWSNAKT
jgi:hypothetical protein